MDDFTTTTAVFVRGQTLFALVVIDDSGDGSLFQSAVDGFRLLE